MITSTKTTKDEYTIGKGPAPDWCRGLLTHFQKYDGTIGYEFYGKYKDFDLNVGDKLIRKGKQIEVKRMWFDDSEKIPAGDQKARQDDRKQDDGAGAVAVHGHVNNSVRNT